MRKYKSNLFSILACICLFFYQEHIYAQSLFQPGFIISQAGDTIHGLIDNQEWQLSQQICVFKSSSSAERVTYTPQDIEGYRFTDGKYYISKEFEGKRFFFEYLIKGKLNIYYILKGKTGQYFMDMEDVSLMKIPYKEGIRTRNNKLYQYKSTTHLGLLSYYTREATGLSTQIEAIKTPQHKNLIALAKNYHNKVCDDEVCIVYEKRVSTLKVYLEPIIGVQKYSLWDDYSLTYGANMFFWVPGSYERFYIKTGLNFITNTDSSTFYKIPLQVQYIYPGKKWKPKGGLGVNMYLGSEENLAYGGRGVGFTSNVHAGLNFQVSKGLILSSTFNVESGLQLFRQDEGLKLISFGLNVGLFMKII